MSRHISGTFFNGRRSDLKRRFISFNTGEYKLHYYETPTSMKFVMLTDTKTSNLRVVLHQIWATLYVEYVVKNPLSPVEHSGGIGVNNELFELGLDRFVVGIQVMTFRRSMLTRVADSSLQSSCLRYPDALAWTRATPSTALLSHPAVLFGQSLSPGIFESTSGIFLSLRRLTVHH